MVQPIDQVLSESFNTSNYATLRKLVSLEEAEKGQLLTALTSKLYDDIVNKIDDIDFGTIPLSKGDITKIENYEQLLECIRIMTEIVTEYKQDTAPLDTILTAIENIKSRTAQWEKAYVLNIELPIILYNTIVLSIVSGVSIMIGTCIDFIKNGSESFEISFDRQAYNKSKDNLLYRNLAKFNTSCAKGDTDRVLANVFANSGPNAASKNLLGPATIGAVGIVAMIALAKNIIPILQELTFCAYHAKQSVSDYFAVQADLLQANANNLEYKANLDAKQRKEIYKRQSKIADRFRKISNTFAIKMKKAEISTDADMKKVGSTKYTYDDIMVSPGGSGSSGSSLF